MVDLLNSIIQGFINGCANGLGLWFLAKYILKHFEKKEKDGKEKEKSNL